MGRADGMKQRTRCTLKATHNQVGQFLEVQVPRGLGKLRMFLLSTWALAVIAACGSPSHDTAVAESPQDERPNVLLIVADDLGWSDLGAFGGEISTPNLDELAFAGLRLTDFTTAPTCSPTRAALLSGVDNHLSGLGNMEEELGPNQTGRPGYEGFLNNRVVSIARLLGDAGYQTMMAGKWHLGHSVERGPESRGFTDAFVLPGGGNHFNDNRAVYIGGDLNEVTKVRYRENGTPVPLPEDYYSSAYFTDKLIEFMSGHQEQNTGEPFFAFASYHAPHWPLQAPDEFIERYQGVYDDGYDPIRQNRLARMQKLGLVAEAAQLVDSPLWPSWNDLSETTQIKESRRMQVYAGMVEALDFHIGRLINHLKSTDELSNTVIIFMSDNGAEGNDVHHIVPGNAEWIQANFDNSIENMGKANSFIGYGPRWAEVSMTPFRGFKGLVTQGGVLSPAFVTYPHFEQQNGVYDGYVSVLDIVPTLLDLADVDFTPTDGTFRPSGKSLVPFLRGEIGEVHAADHVAAVELFNRRSVRKGDWKLVWQEAPFGIGDWQLYNLASDPAEQIDVSEGQATIRRELIELWNEYEEENNVIIDPDLDLKYSTINRHFEH
jgi:arylsulfatase A-like enzyme